MGIFSRHTDPLDTTIHTELRYGSTRVALPAETLIGSHGIATRQQVEGYSRHTVAKLARAAGASGADVRGTGHDNVYGPEQYGAIVPDYYDVGGHFDDNGCWIIDYGFDPMAG